MLNTIQIFPYAGNDVTFDLGEEIIVNATEMARPFGKKPEEWLRTEDASGLVRAMRRAEKPDPSPGFVVGRKAYQGLPSRDLWMHEHLARAFALWLSADLHVWYAGLVRSLHAEGLGRRLQTSARPRPAAEAGEAPESRLARLLDSEEPMPVEQVAGAYGMSVGDFNQLLADLGIQRFEDGVWKLSERYAGKGYLDNPQPGQG